MESSTQQRTSRLELWGVKTIEQYINSEHTLFSQYNTEQATKVAIWFSFAVGVFITLIIATVDIFYFST